MSRRFFRVHLDGASGDATPWGTLTSETADSLSSVPENSRGRVGKRLRARAFAAEYRSYLAEPAWLPHPPVHVRLTARDGYSGQGVEEAKAELDAYELHMISPDRSRLQACVTTLATALSYVVALTIPGQAYDGSKAAGPPAAPPSRVDRHSGAGIGEGPPVRLLEEDDKRLRQPSHLADESGQPVQLAAFHTNIVPTPHTNAPGVHTNLWNNHSNVQVPHTNVWSNHSNVPYTVPHTNIVPGDFIF